MSPCIASALLLGATFTCTMERVSTMDPVFAQSLYDSHAIQLVYETPLAIDYEARPYRLVAGYCDLPEISDDGLTYRFRTLHGTATNAVASLSRLRDKSLVSPNAWIMNDVDDIRLFDARNFEIRLRRRVHYFSWLMAMTPCAVRDVNGEGTGAYYLAAWRKNHAMEFVRREPTNDGFDRVRYLVVDDVSTQWLMFLKGELDYLGEISRDNWDSAVSADGQLDPLLTAKGIRLNDASSMDVMYIGINMKDPLLGKNRKLRQALNCALDFPEWERFYNHRILPSNGPVPPGVEGRLETTSPYAFDLEKAKRLLSEAGYPNGIDRRTGRRLTLTLSIGRATQASREQGELLAAFFARIGLKLELDFRTWDAFLKAVNDGRVQMYSMGWVGDYPDAQNFLQLFYSKNVSPGPNHSCYVSAEFDCEYEAALNAVEVGERNAHWRRCQEIVREDCPWLFLHYNKAATLTGPKVGNYRPSAFSSGNERFYRVNQ